MVTDTGKRDVVTAQVLGHPLHNNKPTTQLKIEAWSEYPIVIYGTTPEQQEELPAGSTRRVVLEAGRLKDGKDPERPYNWFWNYRGLVGDQAMPEPPAPSTPQQPTRVVGTVDARQASIERQVAFKEAVSMAMSLRGPTELDLEAGASLWDMIWEATNEGERILNRTYTTMSDDNGLTQAPIHNVPDVVIVEEEKEDGHLF